MYMGANAQIFGSFQLCEIQKIILCEMRFNPIQGQIELQIICNQHKISGKREANVHAGCIGILHITYLVIHQIFTKSLDILLLFILRLFSVSYKLNRKYSTVSMHQ